MLWKTVNPYLVIVLIWLIVLGIAGLIFVMACYFFFKSAKKDFKEMLSFIRNVFAGVTGGIVVAMFLDLKTNDKINIFTCVLFGAMAIFFIGLMSYLNTSLFHLKKDLPNTTEKKQESGYKRLEKRLRQLEGKEKRNTIAWVALCISIIGTILMPISFPYVEHLIYDKEIGTFDVDLPSYDVHIIGNYTRIPFAITNYGTVPIKIFDKFVYRDDKKYSIVLYDQYKNEIPFKTVYMPGEGLYGFIYLENSFSKTNEQVSFCVNYYPAGRFTKYYNSAKGICTPLYNFYWLTQMNVI